MFESELRYKLLKQLRSGHSKDEIYRELIDQIEEDKLRTTLASIPSAKLRQRYRPKFVMLSIIWGVFLMLELISILDLFFNFNVFIVLSLFAAFYLTLNIWRFNGKFFFSGMIWFGIAVIKMLVLLIDVDQSEIDYPMIFFFTLIYSSILVIGIYLMQDIKTNVFGYYNWFSLKLDSEKNMIFQNETQEN